MDENEHRRLTMLICCTITRHEKGVVRMSGERSIKRAYESLLEHDFEKAIAYFELAVRQEPNNAAFHHRLSITYARSGKLAKALQHAETACRLDGTQEEYRYHLQNLQSKHNVQRAEHLLDRRPDGAALALPLLEEAARLDPLSVEANLLLSVVLLEMKHYERAAAAAKEAYRLDPQHEGARKLLAKFKPVVE
jgi:tetratricopeptide (TPR) repeat protein